MIFGNFLPQSVVVVLVVSGLSFPSPTVPVDQAADDLATQILDSFRPLPSGPIPRTAVLEFSDLSKTPGTAGRALAEELLARLAGSPQFSFVERFQLKKVLDEKGLAHEGITSVSTETLRELGRISGVDLIISGTMSGDGNTRAVVAKVLSTLDGKILGVGRIDSMSIPLSSDSTSLPPADQMTRAADILADSLAKLPEEPGSHVSVRVAVVPFVSLGNSHPQLEEALAEALMVSLFRTNRFDLVERTQLKQLLQDKKLVEEGIVDPTTAAQLGKLENVDAVLTGTVWSQRAGKRISARLISTRNATILAAASATIRDSQLEALSQAGTIRTPQPEAGATLESTIADARIDLNMERYEQAIAKARAVLTRHPKEPQALSILAEAQFMSGKFSEFLETGKITVETGGTVRMVLRHAPKALESSHVVALAVSSRGIAVKTQPGTNGECLYWRSGSVALSSVISAEVRKHKDNVPFLHIAIRNPKDGKKAMEMELLDRRSDFVRGQKSWGGVIGYTGWIVQPPTDAEEALTSAAKLIDITMKMARVLDATPASNRDATVTRLITALGGIDALRAIKDSVFVGSVTLHATKEDMPVMYYWLAPDRFRMDLQTPRGTLSYGFNGQEAWQRSPEGSLVTISEDVRRQIKDDAKTSGVRGFTRLLDSGVNVRSLGIAQEGGRPCDLLEIAENGTSPVQFCVDAVSSLPIKASTIIKVKDNNLSRETVFDAYTSTGGVNFATSVTIFLNGSLYQTTKVTSIRVNTGLSPTLFDGR